MRLHAASICAVAAVLVWSAPADLRAQAGATTYSTTRSSDPADLRAADAQIDQLLRTRDLRVRETTRDTLLPDRQHERLDQYFQGVRVVGGDLTRQTAADGTVSIFGTIYTGIDIDTSPRIAYADARAAVAHAVAGAESDANPELVILPLSDGVHLAYRG